MAHRDRYVHRFATIATVATMLAWIGLAVVRPAAAQGFRIETQVFVGDEEQPVSTATTLFLDGVVYDFLDNPAQTAVFRKQAASRPGRFILLNPELRIRTELTTEKIAGAMTKLQSWAERQEDEFLRFAAHPEFKESFNERQGKLVLTSHAESYTLETTPAHEPDALAEYREFLDWYARLNTLLLGGPPPGPRLEVNAALARYQIIPVSVRLKRTGQEEPLRAEHQFTWRLSKSDHVRIDTACASLAAFRQVDNETFLQTVRDGNSLDGN